MKLHQIVNNSICVKHFNNLFILVSDSISSPFCFSLLRGNYVIITSELLENHLHYQLAIKHELQHLRQKDTYWIYLFELFKAIFYFNPFVRSWLKYNLELQELACDEALINEKSIRSEDYANCLLAAAEQAQNKKLLTNQTYAIAVGLFHAKKSLTYRRISMLYDYKKILPKRTLVLCMSLLISLFVATTSYAINNAMNLQIVKQQLDLTKQSFKSVQLVKCSDDDCAVQVELTPKAADLMHSLTASNINSRINLVWQGHIISSPVIRSALGSKFEIMGFTKGQAISFVKDMQP